MTNGTKTNIVVNRKTNYYILYQKNIQMKKTKIFLIKAIRPQYQYQVNV